ncbi:MAG: patatin-like phospholipase family protein [Pseudomonadaceae bacterium]|nr:patatin-like phospholipase family protein [Pseudomonadaceae bacterium]
MATDRPDVLTLLRQRREGGSRFGQRGDPWKLWLVLESGGQAGAILGGFVSALEALGYRDCFDGVVGSSSGAMTGAYFAAGQARMGTTIYAEDNCDGRFINPWRLLIRRPVMDLDYLVDEVMGRVKPLDCGVLQKLDMPVFAVVTRRDGKKRLLPLHGVSAAHVRANMKASARVPLWGSRNLRGHHLWDGCLCEPVPVGSAVEQGATHVLHLSRHDCPLRPYSRMRWVRHVEDMFYRWHIPGVYQALRARQQADVKGVAYMRLFGPQKIGVGCVDKEALWRAIFAAYRHGCVWLGEKEAPLPPMWRL